MSRSFNKHEKLKSEKAISDLFMNGQTITLYPLRLIYKIQSDSVDSKTKTAVSVSKRNFKRAVDRNRIKRLLREAYRLNKSHFFNNTNNEYALMILYLGKDMPDFNLINSKLKLLLGKFSTMVAKEK